MHRLRPTPSVLDIAHRLEAAGFDAWCVGGAIRDAFLGGNPIDWDLASAATPEQVRDLFGRRRTIPVGVAFGTVAVLDDAGIPHEITTFRRDVDTDGRHAVVEFGMSVDEDLARRDFTINAMAYRPRTGELRDPYFGRRDLEARLIRAVGDPHERLREDRLRALRAIRFAGRFDFALEPETLAAIRAASPHLTRLSAERVQQELVKTMQQVERPTAALKLWRDTGALRVLVPALESTDDANLETLDFLPRDGAGGRTLPQRTSIRIAALFLDLGASDVRRAMTALRFSKHEVDCSATMADSWRHVGSAMEGVLVEPEATPSDVQARRWLGAVGRLRAGAFLRLASARWAARRARGEPAPLAFAVHAMHRKMSRQRYAEAIEVADLAIGGDELRQAGIPVGPIYAKILHALLDVVIHEPARNTPAGLLNALPEVMAMIGQEQAL